MKPKAQAIGPEYQPVVEIQDGGNIEQPTSNIEHPMKPRAAHWMLGVGCSVLAVRFDSSLAHCPNGINENSPAFQRRENSALPKSRRDG
jgi:hypothetical protein